jgi:hypothetical protein
VKKNSYPALILLSIAFTGSAEDLRIEYSEKAKEWI